jgi:uncharacterized protein involved in outer membrane biogenesis
LARGRYLRHVLAVIAVLLIALVATVVVFLYTADFNQYRSIIERTVANATGRQLEIKGDLVIQMTPRPQLAVADVTLANAPWGSRPHMARVGKLLVQLEVLPLLTGTLEVSQITPLSAFVGHAHRSKSPARDAQSSSSTHTFGAPVRCPTSFGPLGKS